MSVICYVAASSASGHWRTLSDPAKAVLEIAFWALDVAAAVGLWLFRSWARWLFIILIVFFFAAALSRPVAVISGRLIIVGFIQYVLAGAIIAMSVLPTVADVFRPKT
ncbi:MAG TPA: hypothetical protein VF511_07100 [Chthoniobacterales bacterium]